MPDSDYELGEIPEIEEISEEEGKKDKNLLADPSQANAGVLDDENPAEFVRLEEEASEGVILAEDVGEEEGEEVPSQ
jgi:hypothetical protein